MAPLRRQSSLAALEFTGNRKLLRLDSVEILQKLSDEERSRQLDQLDKQLGELGHDVFPISEEGVDHRDVPGTASTEAPVSTATKDVPPEWDVDIAFSRAWLWKQRKLFEKVFGIHENNSRRKELKQDEFVKYVKKFASRGLLNSVGETIGCTVDAALRRLFEEMDVRWDRRVTFSDFTDLLFLDNGFIGVEDSVSLVRGDESNFDGNPSHGFHNKVIEKIIFSVGPAIPEGMYFTIGKDSCAQSWEGSTMTLLRKFEFKQSSNLMDIIGIHHGRKDSLAVCSFDRKVHILSFTFERHRIIKTKDPGMCVCYVGQSEALLVGTSRGTIYGHKFDDGKPLFEFTPFHEYIKTIQFVPSMGLIVSSCPVEKKLCVSHRLTPTQIRVVETSLSEGENAILFVRKSGHFVTGGFDSNLCLWDTSLHPIKKFKGHSAPVIALAEGDRQLVTVISLADDREVRVWDLRRYECICTYTPESHAPENIIGGLTFNWLHNKILVTCRRLSCYELYSPFKLDHGHKDRVVSISYSDEYESLESFDAAGVMCSWDVKTGVQRYRCMGLIVTEVETTQDVSMLGSAAEVAQRTHNTTTFRQQNDTGGVAMGNRRICTVSYDGLIRMWVHNNTTCQKTFRFFAPNSTRLVHNYSICLVDAVVPETGDVRHLLAIATETEPTIKVWDLQKPSYSSPLKVLLSGEGVVSLTSAHQMLVAAYRSHLRIWNTITWVHFKLTSPLTDLYPRIQLVADAEHIAFLEGFSRMLVSVGHAVNGTSYLVFWSLDHTTACLQYKTSHNHVIRAMTVGVGNFVFTGDEAGYIMCYDVGNVKLSRGTLSPSDITAVCKWKAANDVTGLAYISTYCCVAVCSSTNVTLWRADGVCIGELGNQETFKKSLLEKNVATWRVEEETVLSAFAKKRDQMKERDKGERLNAVKQEEIPSDDEGKIVIKNKSQQTQQQANPAQTPPEETLDEFGPNEIVACDPALSVGTTKLPQFDESSRHVPRRWKLCRFYIALGILDMHTERKILHENILPEIRQRCRRNYINLMVVDLRVGFNKESDIAVAEMISLVLTEIDLCRPMFAAVVGQSYGNCLDPSTYPKMSPDSEWIFSTCKELSLLNLEILYGCFTEDGKGKVAAKQEQKKPTKGAKNSKRRRSIVAELRRRSISAIKHENEKLQSAMNRKEPCGIVLVRSDGFLDHVPHSYHSMFQGSGAEERYLSVSSNTAKGFTKLEMMKDMLLDFDDIECFMYEPTFEGKYDSLSNGKRVPVLDNMGEFEDRMSALIWQMISTKENIPIFAPLQTLGLGLGLDEVDDATWAEMTLARHRDFEQCGRLMCGNEKQLHELTGRVDHIMSGGPRGSGKSATLNRFASTYKDLNRKHNLYIFAHFPHIHTSLRAFLSRLCHSIRKEFFLQYVEIPHHTQELIVTLRRLLHLASSSGDILIIVDDIDKLQDPSFNSQPKNHVVHWLPRKVSRGVKFLFSCETPHNDAIIEELRNWCNSEVARISDLDTEGKKHIVKMAEDDFNGVFSQLFVKQSNSPLFVSLSCKYLQLSRLQGDALYHPPDMKMFLCTKIPTNLEALYSTIMQTLEKAHGEPVVRKMLLMLSLAVDGLTECECLDLFALCESADIEALRKDWLKLREGDTFCSLQSGSRSHIPRWCLLRKDLMPFLISANQMTTEEEVRQVAERKKTRGSTPTAKDYSQAMLSSMNLHTVESLVYEHTTRVEAQTKKVRQDTPPKKRTSFIFDMPLILFHTTLKRAIHSRYVASAGDLEEGHHFLGSYFHYLCSPQLSYSGLSKAVEGIVEVSTSSQPRAMYSSIPRALMSAPHHLLNGGPLCTATSLDVVFDLAFLESRFRLSPAITLIDELQSFKAEFIERSLSDVSSLRTVQIVTELLNFLERYIDIINEKPTNLFHLASNQAQTSLLKQSAEKWVEWTKRLGRSRQISDHEWPDTFVTISNAPFNNLTPFLTIHDSGVVMDMVAQNNFILTACKGGTCNIWTTMAGSRTWQNTLTSYPSFTAGNAGVYRGMLSCVQTLDTVITGTETGSIVLWPKARESTSQSKEEGAAVVAGREIVIDAHAGGILALALSTGVTKLVEQRSTRKFSMGERLARTSMIRQKSLLASGASDGRIKVFDLVAEKQMYSIRAHVGSVRCLTFSSDSQYLVSGGSDSCVQIWNASDGQLCLTLSHFRDHVLCMVMSPDDSILVCGSADKSIVVYDWSDIVKTCDDDGDKPSYQRKVIRHSAPVNCVAMSLDASMLASGSDDHNVLLWSVQRWEPVCTLPQFGSVRRCCFAKGATVADNILVTSIGSSVKLWEIPVGTLTAWEKTNKKRPNDITPNPTRRGSSMITLKATNLNELYIEKLHSAPIRMIRATDQFSILTVGNDLRLNFFDVCKVPGQDFERKTIHFMKQKTIDTTSVSGLRWSDELQSYILTFEQSPSLFILTGENKIQELSSGHEKPITCVTTTTGDNRCNLATGSADGSIKFWNIRPQFRRVVRQASSSDSSDVEDEDRPPTRSNTSSSSSDDENAREEEYLANAMAVPLQTFSAVHPGGVVALDFSPNTNFPLIVSTGDDGSVASWDVNQGRAILRYPFFFKCRVSSMEFSPDGSVIVCGLEDGSIQVLNPQTFATTTICAPHRGLVSGVEFVDGDHFVTCSADHTLRIICCRTGSIRGEFISPVMHAFTCIVRLTPHILLAGDETGGVFAVDVQDIERRGIFTASHSQRTTTPIFLARRVADKFKKVVQRRGGQQRMNADDAFSSSLVRLASMRAASVMQKSEKTEIKLKQRRKSRRPSQMVDMSPIKFERRHTKHVGPNMGGRTTVADFREDALNQQARGSIGFSRLESENLSHEFGNISLPDINARHSGF